LFAVDADDESKFNDDPRQEPDVSACDPCLEKSAMRSPGLSGKSSAPHERTRNDHATETAEDYVEAVAEQIGKSGSCRVTDLSKRFAVSHVTVSRIIARLQAEGLVDTEPYQPISLTAKGKRLAEKCRTRHDLVFQFLLALGIDERTAAIDAEGIEHHVSPATLAQFAKFLQQQAKP
jgi:DtxR family manganese transport transcriptional regulator